MAPVSADPYWGGAAYLGWQPSNKFELGTLFGSGENKVIGGKRLDLYGQAISVVRFLLKNFPTKISLDWRYKRQSWRTDNDKVTPLTQQSASVTTSMMVAERLWGLFGFHMGRGDRHFGFDETKSFSDQNLQKIDQIFGYQIETGFLKEIGTLSIRS